MIKLKSNSLRSTTIKALVDKETQFYSYKFKNIKGFRIVFEKFVQQLNYVMQVYLKKMYNILH